MSSAKKAEYDVGRLFFFFKGEDEIPYQVRTISLKCHVGNVTKLMEHWQKESDSSINQNADFVADETRDALKSACHRHDIAKPKCFQLYYKAKVVGKKDRFIYSFAGHRFKAPAKEMYEDALIRGHHDFSVQDITEASYKLNQQFKGLSEEKQQQYRYMEDPSELLRRFRTDLYILEMSDQVEAELETRLLDPRKDATTRNFVDFSMHPVKGSDEENPSFLVEPYPWNNGQPLQIDYEYQDIEIPEEERQRLKKKMEEAKKGEGKEKKTSKISYGTKLTEFKDWLLSQLSKDKLEQKSLRIQPLASQQRELTEEDCEAILGFPTLNPMQQEILERLHTNSKDKEEDSDFSTLLRSPTGSGKTEAILWPCLLSKRRLILALPARSLLDDHRQRVEKILQRAANLTKRPFSMIIDTGERSQSARYLFQPDSKDSSKEEFRHLYKADVILTTIDKLLFRYFGYQDKTKSMIFPHRLMQGKTLIAFDEAHSYDSLAWTNFRMLVKTLYEEGQDLLLMTATMPKRLFEHFNFLDIIDFQKQTSSAKQGGGTKENVLHQRLLEFTKETQKSKNLPWHPEKKIYHQAVEITKKDESKETDNFIQRHEEYESDQNQKMLELLPKLLTEGKDRLIFTVNTVRAAISLYKEIKEFLEEQKPSIPCKLYHGRLANLITTVESRGRKEKLLAANLLENPRKNRYQEIKELDEKNLPYILVTTQAIEVGCDLNAKVLVTAICPPAQLIQRAGRCNRRNFYSDAEIHVIGSHIPDFLSDLSEQEQQSYIAYLTEKSGKHFAPSECSQFISKQEEAEDPRLIEIFEMLYEYVYEGDLSKEPLHRKGLVITRSWEPTVTLRYSSGAFRRELKVPINRLKIKKDSEKSKAQKRFITVHQKVYDPGTRKYEEKPLIGGEIYYIPEVIVEINSPEQKDAMFADGQLEVQSEFYSDEYGFAELPEVFNIFQPRKSMKKIAIYESSIGKRILSYIAPMSEEK